MKLSSLIAVAALLNVNVEQVAAIRRHHHHHHHPHYVQVGKIDDIHTNDPKFAELQAKKVAIQNAIDEETYEKPLTEEEEKEKLDKEIKGLEIDGKIVNAKTKLKDAKKKLQKIAREETSEDGDVMEPLKKAELEKMVPKLESEIADLKVEQTKEEAEPVKEKSEKLKDLEKSLKDVSSKQAVEVKALDKVEAKIKSLVDPAKLEEDPMDKHVKPKKDLTPYQKNLEKILKEEEEKEQMIEERKEKLKNVPKNPVVEASEIAEEQAVEDMKSKRIQNYEDAQKLLADLAAKDAAHKAAQKANDALVKGDAELWTANMPAKYLEGYLQTEINDVKQQFAEVEDKEGDSDSDSSDSDSDDE